MSDEILDLLIVIFLFASGFFVAIMGATQGVANHAISRLCDCASLVLFQFLPLEGDSWGGLL